MPSMTISLLQIADRLTLSRRNFHYSSKSTSQVISSLRIALSQACYQESSIWSKEPHSSTHTRLWIIWPKPSLSKMISKSQTTPDMLLRQRATCSWLEGTTPRKESSSASPMYSMNIDLCLTHSIKCSTQGLITLCISIKTIFTYWEVCHTEMSKMAANHLFRVSTHASSSLSQARSGSCFQTSRRPDKASVFASSMRNISLFLEVNAWSQKRASATNSLSTLSKRLKHSILRRTYGRLSTIWMTITSLESFMEGQPK